MFVFQGFSEEQVEGEAWRRGAGFQKETWAPFSKTFGSFDILVTFLETATPQFLVGSILMPYIMDFIPFCL